MAAPLIIILGVAGSGKSTLARELCRTLGGTFIEGDNFHPAGNIEKMKKGLPLTDEDRLPWLKALIAEAIRMTKGTEPVILACSALKESYRQLFREGFPEAKMIYLKGSPSLIETRLRQREGHFFNPGLLKSQFADLQEPKDAIVMDIAQPVGQLVEEIVVTLRQAI